MPQNSIKRFQIILLLIKVYVPTNELEKDDIEKFYEELTKLLEKQPTNLTTINRRFKHKKL